MASFRNEAIKLIKEDIQRALPEICERIEFTNIVGIRVHGPKKYVFLVYI